MSPPNSHNDEQRRQQHEREEAQRRQHEEQQRQAQQHPEHPHGGPPGQTGEHPQGGPPGQPHPEPQGADQKPDRVPNPAEPLSDTPVPKEYPEAKVFLRGGPVPTNYPKMKYHPVHGGVVCKDANDEGGLYPPTDWFDSAELADLARTETEAKMVEAANMAAKLKDMEDKKFPVVRNSVQADESLRRAQAEPL